MKQKTIQSVKAAEDAHNWLVDSDLYSNVLTSAGEYDSKIEPEENASLAAHILNAVTVAVNSFVYEAFSPGDDVQDYEEEIRVLASATALHDTNKYVREAYGFKTDNNTEAAFEVYFGDHDEVDIEGDDFGVEEFLGEGYRDDLLYLVQRCEIGEDSRESRRTDTEFRGLERYCRIGDQVASIAQRDGVDAVYEKLVEKFDEQTVHRLSFDALEQPVLNDLLVGSVKEVLSGAGDGEVFGVPLGSTADTVVYLGNPIDRENLRNRIEGIVPSKVNQEFDFSCKLNWNAFDYDILAEVGIPVDEKEQIIADAFRELLHDGTAGVEGFEHIPGEFDQYFPVLAKAIYLDGRTEFGDPSVQEAYDDIREEQGGQKVKIHFIAHLIRNFDQVREFLKDLAEDLEGELHEELVPESDAIGTAIDRFFGKSTTRPLPSKGNMCFLCGTKTSNPYEKGHETVYQAQGFSRRVPPSKSKSKGGKSICEVCNLEYSLIFNLCERNDINLNRSRPGCRNLGLEIAYFYFDDFVADIRLKEDRMGIELNETVDLGDTSITTNLLQPQYYIQPFSFGDHSGMGEQNQRMLIVRQIMQTARDSGMKVVIGRPFTRFQSADEAFRDEEATRPQELLGLDEARRFGPLPDFVDRTDDSHLRRALALFKIMSMVGQDANMSNPYIHLDRDTFHSIANYAVVNHDNATGLSDIRSYFETYHKEAFMNMQTVAERGIDLFGEQYDSKYKKTKVFREALDAFLSGMHQDMADDELLEYVASQVYAAADREDYAGHVETEDAKAFVEALRSYLVENDLNDLKKLSDWEDALVNSYYYAYDQLLYD